jgi:hypothetical protein
MMFEGRERYGYDSSLVGGGEQTNEEVVQDSFNVPVLLPEQDLYCNQPEMHFQCDPFISFILNVQGVCNWLAYSQTRADLINNEVNLKFEASMFVFVEELRSVIFPQLKVACSLRQTSARSSTAECHLWKLYTQSSDMFVLGSEAHEQFTYDQWDGFLENVAKCHYWNVARCKNECSIDKPNDVDENAMIEIADVVSEKLVLHSTSDYDTCSTVSSSSNNYGSLSSKARFTDGKLKKFGVRNNYRNRIFYNRSRIITREGLDDQTPFCSYCKRKNHCKRDCWRASRSCLICGREHSMKNCPKYNPNHKKNVGTNFQSECEISYWSPGRECAVFGKNNSDAVTNGYLTGIPDWVNRIQAAHQISRLNISLITSDSGSDYGGDATISSSDGSSLSGNEGVV